MAKTSKTVHRVDGGNLEAAKGKFSQLYTNFALKKSVHVEAGRKKCVLKLEANIQMPL